GGGMGIISRGTSTSGHPRFEECCRYHAQFAGAPASVYDTSSADNNDDVTCRSRLAAWIHETGEDAVYFSYHTNAGGGRGTSTYTYSNNPPDGSYVPGAGTAGSDELAARIQSYVVAAANVHFESPWSDRGVRSAYFGELNPSYHDSDVPAALVEALFHDSTADTAYYREPFSRYVLGRAVCHAIIDYFSYADGTTPVFPPEPPVGLKVFNDGPGRITAQWQPPLPDAAGGDDPTSYRVYMGPLATAFNEGTTVDGTSASFDDILPGQTLYIKVTAVNAAGESLATPPAAVGVSPSGTANVLIIDGFTRFDSSMNFMEGTTADPSHRILLRKLYDHREGIRNHAPELGRAGMVFDTWHIEATSGGMPSWDQYELVDFITGKGHDSFPTELWADLEQFVSDGGNLFVSGSHVYESFSDHGLTSTAQSLLGVDAGAPADGNFSVTYTTDGLFSGITESPINYGTLTGYHPGIMESFTPSADATGQILYSGAAQAGVIHSHGSGTVIFFGFPFENVENSGSRDAIMSAIVDFTGVQAPEAVEPDGGVDAEPDSETDADTDAGPCGPNTVCTTETVIGCHCNSGNTKPPRGLLLPLILMGVVLWYRRRSLPESR
ncbi:N-acetylmuramoyl-L-alanine amidase, partial [Myxococcota bacterium]|nr:N-acetylmuramoyl-L-alanine amidase [Myxococcota bacterium]